PALVLAGENPFSPSRAGRQPVSCGCYFSVAVSVQLSLMFQLRGAICPRFVILTRATLGERPPDCGDSPRLARFLLVAVTVLAEARSLVDGRLHLACRDTVKAIGRTPRPWGLSISRV